MLKGGGGAVGAAAFLLFIRSKDFAAPLQRCIVQGGMRRTLAAAAAALGIFAICEGAEARPILYDAVALNIGVNCQWQSRCMTQQRSAMKRSLGYVAKSRPPHWQVQLCNRNAGRAGYRVDWVGFDHCIRNKSLRPARTKRNYRR